MKVAMASPSFSRRSFLLSTAACGAALHSLTLPSLLAQTAGGKRLRLASIGVGGMGASDLESLSSHPAVDVVALCDVDTNNLGGAVAKHGKAKTFADFRRMFDAMAGQIDAVNIATPDHTHAAAAMTARKR
jgi:predicted homoserine dehydrogenase-like protein